jgi:1-acyl-sn-glycerol-3-phosphate acyltransferase
MLSKMKDLCCNYLDSMVSKEIEERVNRMSIRVNEYGVDPFGFDPEFSKRVLPFAVLMYKKYFRVKTYGIENIPAKRVMLISNHSGQIPIDGFMIATGVFLEAEPPRIVRGMVETWSTTLPVFSYFFPRTGQIVGTRENCRHMLERDESIMVFPEGAKGVSKTFNKRYQLQQFGLGFMRLALMTNTPIVPVAVVGAEEQTINLVNFAPLAKMLGMPAVPITPCTPFLGPLAIMPLPTKYHIYFGKPMQFSGNPNDEDVVIEDKVKRVRGTIQRMLRDGLKARKHVFW